MPVTATPKSVPPPLRRAQSCPDLMRLKKATRSAGLSPVKHGWQEAAEAARALRETPRVLGRASRPAHGAKPAPPAQSGHSAGRSAWGAARSALQAFGAAMVAGLKKYGPSAVVGVLAGCLIAISPPDAWLMIGLGAAILIGKLNIRSKALGKVGDQNGLRSDVGRRDPSLVDVPPQIEAWMRMIREPERVTAIYPDAPPSANLLLFGPTGVGKTASLRLLSRKHGYSFHVLQTSDLASKYAGEFEKNVAEAFRVARVQAARTQKPVILLFDEIDTVLGKARGTSEDSSSHYRASVLGEFLQQLDGGVASNHNVFVVAATNRPQDLDGALDSRFNTSIKYDTPSLRARAHFFRDRFERFKNTFTFNQKIQIVLATRGMSYRDLDRTVLYNAAQAAASAGRRAVDFPDIMAVIDAWQTRRDNEKNRQMSHKGERHRGAHGAPRA